MTFRLSPDCPLHCIDGFLHAGSPRCPDCRDAGHECGSDEHRTGELVPCSACESARADLEDNAARFVARNVASMKGAA